MNPLYTNTLSQKVTFSDFRLLKTELVWIYEDEVLPWNLEMTTNTTDETAFYIHSGGVHIHNTHGETYAGEGEWVFIGAGQRSHRFEPGTRVLSLHFTLTWPGGQKLYDHHKPLILTHTTAPKLYNSAKRLERIVEKEFPGAITGLRLCLSSLEKQLRVQSSFLTWLRHFATAVEKQGLTPSRFGRIDPRMLLALNALDQHPLTEPFQEQALAKSLAISTSQLDRLFTKNFNTTPHRYFEQRKLEHAIEQIRHSSDPIKQISYDLGFGSLPHFSSWLRRKTGTSPRELRDKWLRGLNRSSRYANIRDECQARLDAERAKSA